MKKFGTPGLAAPGCASEYVGSLLAGGCAWSSGAGVARGVGVGVGVATLPVSDSVLAAPEGWLTAAPVFCWACGLGFATRFFVLPFADFEFGAAVALGSAVGVGAAVTATVGAAVGVGVESVEPRSTIEATGAGRPGICSWSTGVPGGISTVIVSCWPVVSVTRT